MTDSKLGCFFGFGAPNIGTSRVLKAVPSIEIRGKTSINSASRVSFHYPLTEFNDVVDRYCSHAPVRIELRGQVRRYIYDLTNGHPKLVSSALALIDEMILPDDPWEYPSKTNLQAVTRILEDYETVFERGKMEDVMFLEPSLPVPAYLEDLFRTVFLEGTNIISSKNQSVSNSKWLRCCCPHGNGWQPKRLSGIRITAT